MAKWRKRPAGRSAENPNVPILADAWNEDADFAFSGGAERSVSGVRVTRRRALSYPAVWRAVNLIAGAVAKLPLCVYRVSGKNRDPDPTHPAYHLLKYKPNVLASAFHWKQTLIGHVLLEGNGYAYIDRAGDVPVGLLTLDPERVCPFLSQGQLWYAYDREGADFQNAKRVTTIPAADVIHVRGLGFDGLQGYPVLYTLRDAFGSAIAARDHAGRYFRNKALPGGVLKHPGKLNDQARRNMRESWERLHSGQNSHRVAILEEGVEFAPTQSDARSAQLLENREFDSREIANVFGVPAHKLGDPSKVAYNSLEQENQSFYDDTLSHWLETVSQECRDKLLTEAEKETHDVGFDYQELQRANLAALTAFAEKGLQNGFLNVDESRALFCLNPLPGGKGQDYDPEPPAESASSEPDAVTQGVRQALRPVIEDAGRRACRRLAKVWQRKGSDADAREHIDPIAEMFAPALEALGDSEWPKTPAGRFALATQFVNDYCRQATGEDAVRQLETVAPAGLADYLLGKA